MRFGVRLSAHDWLRARRSNRGSRSTTAELASQIRFVRALETIPSATGGSRCAWMPRAHHSSPERRKVAADPRMIHNSRRLVIYLVQVPQYQIGRASCRERVEDAVGEVAFRDRLR